jgi:hypothetical protein
LHAENSLFFRAALHSISVKYYTLERLYFATSILLLSFKGAPRLAIIDRVKRGTVVDDGVYRLTQHTVFM